MAEDSRLRHGPPVTYVATMVPTGDPDLEARIAAHRARRDAAWETVDAGDDLPGLLSMLRGTVLVDSLGPWVARRTLGSRPGAGSRRRVPVHRPPRAVG